MKINFNAAGEPDGFGDKSSLIGILVLVWIIFAVPALIGFFPAIWNTGVEVTPQNKEKVFSTIRTMLSVLCLVIALFFSYAIFSSVRGISLHPASTPLFLIILFGTIIISVVRLVRLH